jgi:branched-chain amino acid transport system substrate-binding protein
VTVDQDGKVKPYTFRACYDDNFQGLVMAKFAMAKGLKTAFITYDHGNDYTVGLANSFEKGFTDLGGQIVGKETYTKNDTDFSAILTKVAEAKPDVLWIGDYYPIVNLIGAQAKDKGVTAAMMGGDGWDSSDLDVKASDGGFYSNHYDPADPRPIVQSFIKSYGEKYKDASGNPKVPDALATLAYDATNMLLSAIQNGGADDVDKATKAMEALKFDGVSGAITINPFHNPIKAAVVIGVKDGNKSYVETINP